MSIESQAMTLAQFIEQKKADLVATGNYKSVELVRTEEITITGMPSGGYTTSRAFMAKEAALNKEVTPLSKAELQGGRKYLGACIVYTVRKKRHRSDDVYTVSVIYESQPEEIPRDAFHDKGATA